MCNHVQSCGDKTFQGWRCFSGPSDFSIYIQQVESWEIQYSRKHKEHKWNKSVIFSDFIQQMKDF